MANRPVSRHRLRDRLRCERCSAGDVDARAGVRLAVDEEHLRPARAEAEHRQQHEASALRHVRHRRAVAEAGADRGTGVVGVSLQDERLAGEVAASDAADAVGDPIGVERDLAGDPRDEVVGERNRSRHVRLQIVQEDPDRAARRDEVGSPGGEEDPAAARAEVEPEGRTAPAEARAGSAGVAVDLACRSRDEVADEDVALAVRIAGDEVGRRRVEEHAAAVAADGDDVARAGGLLLVRGHADPAGSARRQVADEHVAGVVGIGAQGEIGGGRVERDRRAVRRDHGARRVAVRLTARGRHAHANRREWRRGSLTRTDRKHAAQNEHD